MKTLTFHLSGMEITGGGKSTRRRVLHRLTLYTLSTPGPRSLEPVTFQLPPDARPSGGLGGTVILWQIHIAAKCAGFPMIPDIHDIRVRPAKA